MAFEERDFFHERPETKPAEFTCPWCKRRDQYGVRWLRRTKKERLPAGADQRDRVLYGKLRDHLIRVDDVLVCKTCRRRFDIPSMQSLVFLPDAGQ